MPPEPPEPAQPAPVPSIDDRRRLEHILQAARDIVIIVSGRTRADLHSDMLLRRALLHAITEIGEAAARVTPHGRNLLPALPWGQIVATRNILVHVYWGVDLDIIWSVANRSFFETTPT